MIEKNGNPQRVERIKEELARAGLDALIVSLPTHVLLLSGYWPVVGSAMAIATRDGTIAVLAPQDEEELAAPSWAGTVRLFQPNSLQSVAGVAQSVVESLGQLAQELGIGQGQIGYENQDMYEPASYASTHFYGPATLPILQKALPQASFKEAGSVSINLRAAMTEPEIGQVRNACEVAGFAYQIGLNELKPGLRETEIAAAFQAPLNIEGVGYKGALRAGGFTFCMSGPNAALAGGAYARTRTRRLENGDLVLLHVNSYIDGYWTDITRTYCLGYPTHRQQAMYAAIFEARAAALAAIRPGVKAAKVDAAARQTLERHGFAKDFTHSTGHNVGFAAISFQGPPRLHPASPDTLEVGMVFNVEPSIYIQGYGGIRHCDVVAITETDVEVLTPFQGQLDRLIV